MTMPRWSSRVSGWRVSSPAFPRPAPTTSRATSPAPLSRRHSPPNCCYNSPGAAVGEAAWYTLRQDSYGGVIPAQVRRAPDLVAEDCDPCQIPLHRRRRRTLAHGRASHIASCSPGALSRRSMAALQRFQDLWNEQGAQAWYQVWMGELAALRAKFARLIGAQPHEIAIAPSVSAALSEIASGLDLGARNKVVMADMDFPTLAYQWLAREREGIEDEVVESADMVTLPARRFRTAIDQRTGLVATSRVFYL